MIYYNIDESDYTFHYDDLIFYFSSKFYLQKFIKTYVNFLKDETMKLKLKFKCDVMHDEMILILLYKKIEKRGFKITYKGHKLRENPYIVSYIHEMSFE